MFILLILIFKIVFSTQWTTIEMEDFKSANNENTQLNKIFPSNEFDNTTIIKIRSKFKLDNNLLIFLSSDKCKYCILPYLSSHNFVKIYMHFQTLIPELNFHKFLPPSRFYITNNVLDIHEPTTFLQPLEINFLYKFNGKYSSLKPHILYSSKTNIPNTFEPHIPIPFDSVCAHLSSQNKIIPYKTYVIQTSHQELLILRDDESDQFFVTLQKTKGEFINIARGSGVSEKEFFDYVECIWEAYNLQGCKKHYWKLKSFFTRTYVKYLVYVVKMVFCLDRIFLRFLRLLENFSAYYLETTANYDNLCVHGVTYIVLVLFYVPCFFVFVGSIYNFCVLCYYATLLPFFVLAFPLKKFLFGFNWYSFLFVSQSLASLYVYFFPEIKKCMPLSETIEPGDILPSKLLKIFEIEPKKIMSVVPLLVQKRKKCLVELSDTLIMCCLIFIFGLPLSLLFLACDTYF